MSPVVRYYRSSGTAGPVPATGRGGLKNAALPPTVRECAAYRQAAVECNAPCRHSPSLTDEPLTF